MIESRPFHQPDVNIRTDLLFPRFDEAAARMLMSDGVIVLKGFFDEPLTDAVRTSVRNLLAVHAPVRIVRKLLDEKVADPDRLPYFLKRKPLVIRTDSDLVSSATREAIARVMQFNNRLYVEPGVRAVYGDQVHPLTHAALVRTRVGESFAEHQDSQGVRGFGFAIQTEDTRWKVSPSKSGVNKPDFFFYTRPGNLVVIRERVGDLPEDISLSLGSGFENYAEDGSLVHTGMNLSKRPRYTLNLFSVERHER